MVADALLGDDAEPFKQSPAAGRLCVPVRPSAGGWATRLFRTPAGGGRAAVAFTDPARLRAVLGAAQPWILLAEPALRALVEPLGVHELRIDPAFAAERHAHAPAPVSLPVPALDPVAMPMPMPTPTTRLTAVTGPRPLTALAS
ncbi:SAV_915 family protein [Streptomyces sp. NPDC058718]|uniref:SAV_915 family protein n=1 Tax=Streptomyces sp. NPDC058718 TaxID=3346610 RepID=UPI00368A1A0B